MNRTKAIAYLNLLNDPNKFIFEFDSGLVSKSCIVVSFDDFFNRVCGQRMYERTWNEHINRRKPCKMFLDCELKDLTARDVVANVYVLRVHAEVQKCVAATFLGVIDMPLVLQGSRPGVFSVHLVWENFWCENVDPIKAITDHVAAMNIMGVDVDTGVCPTKDGVPHTLRMPYCSKKSDRSAGPLLPTCDPSSEFSRELFCRHLLTFHSGHTDAGAPLTPLPKRLFSLDDLPETVSRPIKRGKHDEYLVDGDTSSPVFALDWMESVLPLCRRAGFARRVNGGWKCYTRAFCCKAQRWHKKNAMYLNCDAYGELIMTCSDSDCRTVYHQHVSEHEYRVASEPWSVDWDIIEEITKS